MAATQVIYFPFRVQLDPGRASSAWARFKFPSNLPSQSSPAPKVRSSANTTSLISTAGGDGL